MISLAATLLLCLFLGLALDRGLLGGPGRGAIESLGRALTLGFGAAGCISLLADGLGLGVSRTTVILPALALILLFARPALRVRSASPVSGPSPGRIRPALTGVLLLLSAGFLFLALYTGWIRPPYQMDALARWMLKAKAICLDGTLLGPLSQDPGFHFTHQRYPPLVSYVANLPCLFQGGFDGRIASALFPWYAVALVCLVYGALARKGGPLLGSLGALWVASLPLIAFRDGTPPLGVPPGSGAFSALADVPLALFMTATGIAALGLVEKRKGRVRLETVLFLSFAALTKNEGLPFLAGLSLGLLLCLPERRGSTVLAVAGFSLCAYILLWGRIALELPALDENYPARLGLGPLLEGMDRLPLILKRMGKEFFFLPSWNLFWPAVLGLLLLSGRAALAPGNRILWIIPLFQLICYLLAFMITAWKNEIAEQYTSSGDSVSYLMEITLGRLFLHLAPLAALAALRAAPLARKLWGGAGSISP